MLPSPVTSANATDQGVFKTPTLHKCGVLNPPLPLLINTAIQLLLLRFAVTMSNRPSPLTSANATATGCAPTFNTCGLLNPRLPSLINTEALQVPSFAVTMSIQPSPLISANATDSGLIAHISQT